MHTQSMTAYGYGEWRHETLSFTCEIRCLNSRYLEVNVRLPRQLLALETEAINLVKQTLHRGKVDVFVELLRGKTAEAESLDLPTLEPRVVAHVLGMAQSLAAEVERRGLPPMAPLSLHDVLRFEGALVAASTPRTAGPAAAQSHRDGLIQALTAALTATTAARLQEGAALQVAMESLLADLERGRLIVAELRDSVLAHLRLGVQKRVDSVLAQLTKAGHAVTSVLSEERLATELTLASDKADIDEELTRLKTHIAEFHRLLQGPESAGRKLDFLCQEMHREVNTMSNKLVQTEVSQHTLEMKQSIERLRQQVQNIE